LAEESLGVYGFSWHGSLEHYRKGARRLVDLERLPTSSQEEAALRSSPRTPPRVTTASFREGGETPPPPAGRASPVAGCSRQGGSLIGTSRLEQLGLSRHFLSIGGGGGGGEEGSVSGAISAQEASRLCHRVDDLLSSIGFAAELCGRGRRAQARERDREEREPAPTTCSTTAWVGVLDLLVYYPREGHDGHETDGPPTGSNTAAAGPAAGASPPPPCPLDPSQWLPAVLKALRGSPGPCTGGGLLDAQGSQPWLGTPCHRHIELLQQPRGLVCDIKVVPRLALGGCRLWFTGPQPWLERLAHSAVERGLIQAKAHFASWLSRQETQDEATVLRRLRVPFAEPGARR